MATFVQIVDSIVERIIVVSDDDCGNAVFPSSENIGQVFISNLGIDGLWLQTFSDNSVRKQEAQVGFSYDESADVFITPQPFPSWSLDENYDWQAPIDYPADGKKYSWDESNQAWVEFPTS